MPGLEFSSSDDEFDEEISVDEGDSVSELDPDTRTAEVQAGLLRGNMSGLGLMREGGEEPGKFGDLEGAGGVSEEDDSTGLAARVELREGARVILTQNRWVEAGLMNGALGVLRGYMWPEGGDPNSNDPAKWAPLSVFVEFDSVSLGTEESGRPRSFFPDDPPSDVPGSRRDGVPIFRQKISSTVEDRLTRENFPLTLAGLGFDPLEGAGHDSRARARAPFRSHGGCSCWGWGCRAGSRSPAPELESEPGHRVWVWRVWV
mgnify:CR=1 FL=1